MPKIQKNQNDPTSWDLLHEDGSVLVEGESFAVVDGIRESILRKGAGISEVDEVARAILSKPVRTIIGSSWFPSFSQAVAYYRGYGNDREDVMRKIEGGEIHVGTPPTFPGEVRRWIADRRWHYETETVNTEKVR